MTSIYFTDENQFLMSEVIGSILTEQLYEATGNVPMLRCLRPDIRTVAKVFAAKLSRREEVFEMTYRIFEEVAINHNLIERKPYYDYELSMLIGSVLDTLAK